MTHVLDQFKLDGRTAIVTGGAGLLGRQFCRALAEAVANVLAADLLSSKSSEELAKIGTGIVPIDADITDEQSVASLVANTITRFGSVDILVNSAALDPKIGAGSPKISTNFEEFPLDAWKKALDVNLTGMYLCCRAVTRPMLAAGRGSIVNLSSIYGVVAPDQRLYQNADGSCQIKPAYYSVTKAGVLGLTSYLAAYFTGKNIRVNTISPGGVQHEQDDEFLKRYSARTALGRMGRPDDMNGAIVFLASDASAYMTGANLVVDGGWTVW